jgi:hypothetical protein
LLLPGSRDEYINDFLELRTWIDFRDDSNNDYEFHRLVCGAKGLPPGRWHPRNDVGDNDSAEKKLNKLAEYRQKNLIIDDVYREYQCKILDVHLLGNMGVNKFV